MSAVQTTSPVPKPPLPPAIQAKQEKLDALIKQATKEWLGRHGMLTGVNTMLHNQYTLITSDYPRAVRYGAMMSFQETIRSLVPSYLNVHSEKLLCPAVAEFQLAFAIPVQKLLLELQQLEVQHDPTDRPNPQYTQLSNCLTQFTSNLTAQANDCLNKVIDTTLYLMKDKVPGKTGEALCVDVVEDCLRDLSTSASASQSSSSTSTASAGSGTSSISSSSAGGSATPAPTGVSPASKPANSASASSLTNEVSASMKTGQAMATSSFSASTDSVVLSLESPASIASTPAEYSPQGLMTSSFAGSTFSSSPSS